MYINTKKDLSGKTVIRLQLCKANVIYVIIFVPKEFKVRVYELQASYNSHWTGTITCQKNLSKFKTLSLRVIFRNTLAMFSNPPLNTSDIVLGSVRVADEQNSALFIIFQSHRCKLIFRDGPQRGADIISQRMSLDIQKVT